MDFLDVRDNNTLQELTNHYENGVNVFVLIFMVGCGPCNATKPKWHKLKDKKWHNTIVAQIDKDVINTSTGVFNLNDVDGFPTIRYYSKNKKEDYNGERDPGAFEEWINSKVETIDRIDRTKPRTIHTGHFSERLRNVKYRSKRTKRRRSKRIKSKRNYDKN